MSITKTVNKLQSMGFDLSLKTNGNISIKFKGTPSDNTKELLKELKEHKQEAIQLLKDNIVDILASLYSKSASELGEHYLPGCTAWLEENQPEVNDKINEAEKDMWEIGNEVRDGKADIQEFEKALKLYCDLMLQGITLHKSRISK